MPILSLFVLFVVMLSVFFIRERRIANPVLDLSLFKNRVYNFSVLSAMLQSLAMFAVNFLIVFYFQGVRGYSPLTAALFLIPLSIMSAVTGPLSGMVADRIGARLPSTVGLLLQALGLVWLVATPDADNALRLHCRGSRSGWARRGLFFPPTRAPR